MSLLVFLVWFTCLNTCCTIITQRYNSMHLMYASPSYCKSKQQSKHNHLMSCVVGQQDWIVNPFRPLINNEWKLHQDYEDWKVLSSTRASVLTKLGQNLKMIVLVASFCSQEYHIWICRILWSCLLVALCRNRAMIIEANIVFNGFWILTASGKIKFSLLPTSEVVTLWQMLWPDIYDQSDHLVTKGLPC